MHKIVKCIIEISQKVSYPKNSKFSFYEFFCEPFPDSGRKNVRTSRKKRILISPIKLTKKKLFIKSQLKYKYLGIIYVLNQIYLPIQTYFKEYFKLKIMCKPVCTSH